MTCDGSITFEQLIEGLLELFSGDKDSVVIEEVQAFINRSQWILDIDWIFLFDRLQLLIACCALPMPMPINGPPCYHRPSIILLKIKDYTKTKL